MRSPAVLAGIGAVLLAVQAVAQVEAGRDLFATACAECHGDGARGDGPKAGKIDGNVPDLTLIAQRNGGQFPMAETMSYIDGYARSGARHAAMPEFGAALQADSTVLFDSGDGIPTPTPSSLVDLVEFLRSIQR